MGVLAARLGEAGSGQLILNYERELEILGVSVEQLDIITSNRELLLFHEKDSETLKPERRITDFKTFQTERETRRLDNAKKKRERIDIEGFNFEKNNSIPCLNELFAFNFLEVEFDRLETISRLKRNQIVKSSKIYAQKEEKTTTTE